MLEAVERTPASPDDPKITPEEARAGARAIVSLFEHWQVSDEQARAILGHMPERRWADWKSGDFGLISDDLATRLGLLLGVHKGVRRLFADRHAGYRWVSKPNAAFAGLSALDVLADGSMSALLRVRRYLDAESGGW